jgi:hypothetical protein
MWLPVFVDDKLCFCFLNNTLVVFLDELNKLLDDVKELFVEKCIEELVSLEVLGL